MSTVPPSLPPQNSGAPVKKTSPLVWILGGIAVLLCGVMLTCGVVGFIAFRAVKNAGFDPDLMQRNPGLALTKMAAALHPDLEIVATNDRTGKITMREKSTGKVMTFKFDPDKKTLVMTDDEGKEVKISASGNGDTGSLSVQSPDGTVKLGAGAGKAPSWVPVYPGTSMTGTFSAQSADGEQGTFSFKSADAPAKVIAFYQEQLKAGGYSVSQMTNDQGGMVSGGSADGKRSLTVTVGASGSGTEGNIVASEKK